ncbi:MAG: class I mannose-6-phosphate isomerase [Planctomycetaceae bacterium]|nr:class I mannose-6-phosphate isomerase [Planctomycetaceae bacterium]
MPPLRLLPLFKQRPWGGQQLANQWRKPNQSTTGWGESWEVVDLGDDQSQVLGGPFDGRLLHDLVREYPNELLGQHAACGQFPLLFKFLDAAETMSVQVHPNDAQAATLAPGQHGKSEAWVILAAAPNSRLSVGLKSGVDRATLERHLTAGTVEQCLHSIPVRVGDVISVPAGTVHAIGAGIALAEIQQPSDVTFRLFDWNRRDAHGRSRPLHIEQALQCIDFSLGPVSPIAPRQLDTTDGLSEELIQTEHFVWRRHTLTGTRFRLPEEDRCRILSLIEGHARIVSSSGREPLSAGESIVIPATCGPVEIEPTAGAVMLETLPC